MASAGVVVRTGRQSTDDPVKAWNALLNEHIERSLNLETDLLAALSDAAEELSKSVGAEYYAGIWGKDVIPQLLWKRHSAESTTLYPKPTQYLAPSWSWASVNGGPVMLEPLSLYDDQQAPEDGSAKNPPPDIRTKLTLAKAVVVSTKPSGTTRFGSVSEGHIIIEGRFRSIPCPDKFRHAQASGPSTKPSKLIALLSSHYYPSIHRHDYSTPLEREYQQQHKSHPKQAFALLELARWKLKYPRSPFRKKPAASQKKDCHPLQDRGLYLLMLESVDEEASSYRRLGLLRIEYSRAGDTKGATQPVDFQKQAYKEIIDEDWDLKEVKII